MNAEQRQAAADNRPRLWVHLYAAVVYTNHCSLVSLGPKARLVARHSGRTLVFGRRTFPVLRSIWIWQVTMGKSSAVGRPTKPTQPFILHGSINELQSDVRSGGAICWMLTGWRPGVVDWGGGVFAGCLPRVQLFVITCNGRPHLAL